MPLYVQTPLLSPPGEVLPAGQRTQGLKVLKHDSYNFPTTQHMPGEGGRLRGMALGALMSLCGTVPVCDVPV